MVLHPAVQAKAQAELDSVIGSGRLPDYNDRPSLPYIDAIVKEVLRWNPVAPLGTYLPPTVMIDGIDFILLQVFLIWLPRTTSMMGISFPPERPSSATPGLLLFFREALGRVAEINLIQDHLARRAKLFPANGFHTREIPEPRRKNRKEGGS